MVAMVEEFENSMSSQEKIVGIAGLDTTSMRKAIVLLCIEDR